MKLGQCFSMVAKMNDHGLMGHDKLRLEMMGMRDNRRPLSQTTALPGAYKAVRFGKRCFAVGFGAIWFSAAPLAFAESPDMAGGAPGEGSASASDDWDGDYGLKAERRSDVMLSLTGGLLLGSVAGYPNEMDKIDNPNYRAETGLAPGASGTFVLGVALRDWLSFGLGFGQSSFQGSDHEGSAYFFVVRTEAFPLFNTSSFLAQDLGFALTGGIGGLKLEQDGEETADGGALSLVGVGAFWEVLKLGPVSMGPALDYQYQYSKSVSAHLTTLGVRAAFYGGP